MLHHMTKGNRGCQAADLTRGRWPWISWVGPKQSQGPLKEEEGGSGEGQSDGHGTRHCWLWRWKGGMNALKAGRGAGGGGRIRKSILPRESRKEDSVADTWISTQWENSRLLTFKIVHKITNLCGLKSQSLQYLFPAARGNYTLRDHFNPFMSYQLMSSHILSLSTE